jgi:hypothetical protein
MLQSKLFKPFSITLVYVVALDLIAIKLHLFSTIMWFDMIMHSSGGFFIGLFAVWVLTWKGKIDFSYGQLLLIGVGTALIVGVLWELFELYTGITYFFSPDYWGDNGMDIIMDLTGGLVSVWYSYYRLKKVN